MNKLSIFLLGALALGISSCDDAPGIAPVQTNPQPPIYEDSQISCSLGGVFAGAGETKAIDLDEYKLSDNGVSVVTFSTTEAFPKGAYPSGVLQISSLMNSFLTKRWMLMLSTAPVM